MESKIIAVAGGAASGKSTIVDYIKNYFADNLFVMGHDNYYKAHDDIPFEEREKLNFDESKAFDNEMFIRGLKKLKSGEEIDMPTYDYNIHTRSDKTIYVEPTKNMQIL